MQRFAVIVEPDKDEGFVATVPGFPGIVGHGHTEEGALADAKAALEAIAEASNGEGDREGTPRPSNSNEALEVVAAKQGVKVADDFDALLGDFWPEDESADEFIAALCGWRHDHGPKTGAPKAP